MDINKHMRVWRAIAIVTFIAFIIATITAVAAWNRHSYKAKEVKDLAKLVDDRAAANNATLATLANLNNRVATLQDANKRLDRQVDDLQTINTGLTNQIATLRTNNATLRTINNDLEAENKKLNNQVATLQKQADHTALDKVNKDLEAENSRLWGQLTNATPVTPAASPIPTGTNAAPAAAGAAGVGVVFAVVTTPKNGSLVFYQDGTITITNSPVGMVGGKPVLIDNVSSKLVRLTIKRLTGRGSITFEVASATSPTVMLLEGQYECSWRIKGRGEIANKCTMTVLDGDPADLVVGKGVFANVLTLVDQ